MRRAAGWEETTVATALDLVTEKILAAPRASAFLATPQATNEDVYMFRLLSERAGGMLDFRVGNPQARTQVREDNVLLRADRSPNTTGCLDQGIGRDGVDAILKACASEAVKVLVLQGSDLLADPRGTAIPRPPRACWSHPRTRIRSVRRPRPDGRKTAWRCGA